MAVTFTAPGKTAVTTPLPSTVARATLLELHVTDWETVDGETVALSCIVAPTATVLVGAITVTPLTGVTTGAVGSDGVAEHAASIPIQPMLAKARIDWET